MKAILRYFIITACLAIGVAIQIGCQTLSTTAGSQPSGVINGNLYYLPIGKITIAGDFDSGGQHGGSNKSAENVGSDKTDLVLPQATASPSHSRSGKPTRDEGGGGTPGTTISAGQLAITLTPEVEADESAGEFYVTPQSNYFYDDDATVAVNSRRLLTSGKVTTQDRTADIVGGAASLATQIAPKSLLGQPQGSQEPFNFSFYPSSADQVTFLTRQLRKRGIGLTITRQSVSSELNGDSPGGDLHAQAAAFGKNGLLFRLGISYKVRIVYPVDVNSGKEPVDKELVVIRNTQQFVLPDVNRLYGIEYPRMAFVKKIKEIGFGDGMLTEYHQAVPSPVLGFLGIPKAIIQAIISIPGGSTPGGSAASSGTASQ